METTSDKETKLCENCKKHVSITNFSLHSVHCQRNISLCEVCKEPFPKNEIESHKNEVHVLINCEKCGEQVEKQNVDSHQSNECRKRLVKCYICDLSIPVSDQDDHEDYCGSRTELCHVCGRYVMLKFMDIHLSSNHQFISMEDNINTTKPDVTKVSGIDIKPKNRELKFLEDLNGPSSSIAASSLLSDIEYAHGHALEDLIPDTTMPMRNLAGHFSNSLNLNGLDSPSSEASGFMASYDPFLDEISDFQRCIGNTSTKLPVTNKDDDCIPCEFCNELITADLLMDHQDTCSRVNYPSPRREFASPTFASGSLEGNDSADPEDITTIPCEYCNKSFDADSIIEHQSSCIESGIYDLLRHSPPASTVSPPQPAQVPSHVDEEMDYINDMFLKEAIDNSLKGQNQLENHLKMIPSKRTEKTNLATSSRAPKVRNVPIKIEGRPEIAEASRSYSGRHHSDIANFGEGTARRTTDTRLRSLANHEDASQDPSFGPKPPLRKKSNK